jgi:hypothetical protein
MNKLIRVIILGMGLGFGLACRQPACRVPMTQSDEDRQAWLGTSSAGQVKINKAYLNKNLDNAKLYFLPLDLTVLECPTCVGFKLNVYSDVDNILKESFGTYFKAITIVENQVSADYVIFGKLVRVDKDSFGWILIKLLFASGSSVDDCLWWFKITDKKTGATVLTYQLNASGPQGKFFALSFQNMARAIHAASDKLQNKNLSR